jgi:monoamine oxidase
MVNDKPRGAAAGRRSVRWRAAARPTRDQRHARLDRRARGTREREVHALLWSFGALDEDLRYTGSSRAGHAEPPGITPCEPGRVHSPLRFEEVAKATSARIAMSLAEARDQTPVMLQSVGGMDAIARALGATIRYGAEVVKLGRAGDGARVVWRDRKRGAETAIAARGSPRRSRSGTEAESCR